MNRICYCAQCRAVNLRGDNETLRQLRHTMLRKQAIENLWTAAVCEPVIMKGKGRSVIKLSIFGKN